MKIHNILLTHKQRGVKQHLFAKAFLELIIHGEVFVSANVGHLLQ